MLERSLFPKSGFLFTTTIACLFLWVGMVHAQQEQADPALPQVQVDPQFASPVVVEGDELFVVRGTSALPADERAGLVAARIVEFAERSNIQTVEMRIEDGSLGKHILADDRLMTVTTQADSEFEKMELEVLAELQAEAIMQAILIYRADRSDDARINSVVAAFVWTVVFIALVALMRVVRDRLPDRIAASVKKRTTGVGQATNDMVNSTAMAALVRYLMRLVLLIFFLFLTYYYLSFVLLAFAETKPTAQLLITYLTGPIVDVLKGFGAYLPNLIALFVITALTRFIIKGVRLFFVNVEAGTIRLDDFEPTWVWPTFNIIRVILISIAVVISFPYIPGSESRAFQGLAILAGLMVSVGSNSVIANALSGLFVIYRRSTNIGDRIKIGGHIGDVVEIKLMETIIKSIKNELISIPNAQLLNSEVINYSSRIDGRGLLLHTMVGIGYEEPRDKIEAMLVEAANRTKGLLKSPEPFVLINALADYAINYQINGYTTRGSSMPKTLSNLHRNIIDVFNENDVQIMTPSYIADPAIAKIPDAPWNGVLKKSKTNKKR